MRVTLPANAVRRRIIEALLELQHDEGIGGAAWHLLCDFTTLHLLGWEDASSFWNEAARHAAEAAQ